MKRITLNSKEYIVHDVRNGWYHVTLAGTNQKAWLELFKTAD